MVPKPMFLLWNNFTVWQQPQRQDETEEENRQHNYEHCSISLFSVHGQTLDWTPQTVWNGQVHIQDWFKPLNLPIYLIIDLNNPNSWRIPVCLMIWVILQMSWKRTEHWLTWLPDNTQLRHSFRDNILILGYSV